MATRTARTAWTGGLMDGNGQVELSSSGAGTFDVTFPKRIAEEADGTTPEELIAAAHSSCFAMQFSAVLAEAGGKPVALDVHGRRHGQARSCRRTPHHHHPPHRQW